MLISAFLRDEMPSSWILVAAWMVAGAIMKSLILKIPVFCAPFSSFVSRLLMTENSQAKRLRRCFHTYKQADHSWCSRYKSRGCKNDSFFNLGIEPSRGRNKTFMIPLSLERGILYSHIPRYLNRLNQSSNQRDIIWASLLGHWMEKIMKTQKSAV